ncbi:MAG: helix-turn-helix domain-containing protein [Coriobacteriia bacterium]|nr:helix-turn-helix domain-containing protein [Coriobacteriia bacterium]
MYEVPQAMSRLSIGRTKLYELVSRGELKLVKIGAKSLITDESITAYVEQLIKKAG